MPRTIPVFSGGTNKNFATFTHCENSLSLNVRTREEERILISCGHFFCQQCLVEWANAARGVERDLQRRRVAILPRRRVRCPTCQQDHRTPNFRLEEFARVNRILEHPRDEEEEEVPVPMKQADPALIAPVLEDMDEIVILD
ncbi:hypothetical protein CAEBREN_24203 [Caenorhabditis brenneri]|uniref:RING-type domain-containing protein n=1 Tax=Caenorhabditis brenneri TaxID=135651 RepID=G0P359_CAEBE|nr:hypothetical protein CAEBREN_24203 [Caenorhabditis brenneri]